MVSQSQQKIIDIVPGSLGAPIAPLLQPDLRIVYSHRAQRLRALAVKHAMKDYLSFAADIVDAQYLLLQTQPLLPKEIAEPLLVDWHTAPLSKKAYSRSEYWRFTLDALLDIFAKLPQYSASPIGVTVAHLLSLDEQAKESAADQLLAGDTTGTGSEGAPFFWAALSLYWTQLARQHPLDPHETHGVERHVCPICGSEPVASVITMGPPEGLRYLHCNLCETQWHYVRAQCSNCENSGKLHYWSLDDRDAAVKTESCGDCHSHLKIIYQNKDFNVDPVADDLASLALDARMEEEGFDRSTINPFLFPGT